MGQRELLLTIGAIVIFSLMSLSINRLAVRNSVAITDQQIEFFGVSLAQRFIEEAKVKAFDENTIVGNPAIMPSGFTSVPMGPGVGEVYPNFDDVDDFNGFTTTESTNMGNMDVSISVDYVSDANLDSVINPTKSFYKKMTVTVQSDYLNHSITAEYVFAFQKNP
ncbi:MAG: hypothetical protein ACE5IW_03660 [bacterium]